MNAKTPTHWKLRGDAWRIALRARGTRWRTSAVTLLVQFTGVGVRVNASMARGALRQTWEPNGQSAPVQAGLNGRSRFGDTSRRREAAFRRPEAANNQREDEMTTTNRRQLPAGYVARAVDIGLGALCALVLYD